MPDEEIDAVVLFRPRSAEKLTPFLDLDDDSEEDEDGERLYAEPLEDGSFLVFTFQPYAAFVHDESALHEWLSQFGDALPEIHDDPRGLLFFPDSCEPEGQTYDAVVAEVEEQGIWVALADEALPPDMAAQLAALGVNPEHLEQLAGQVLGDPSRAGKGPSSFELGRLFEGMQRHVFDALGVREPGSPVDQEDAARDQEDAPPPKPKGGT